MDVAHAVASGEEPRGAPRTAGADHEAGPPRSAGLTERDARILAFERRRWHYTGAKEAAIRAEFDLTPTRYHQILNVLIDSPAALVAEPMLVGRLRRLRERRRRIRPAYAEHADAPDHDDLGPAGR